MCLFSASNTYRYLHMYGLFSSPNNFATLYSPQQVHGTRFSALKNSSADMVEKFSSSVLSR
jgi:hypothetical protein